MLSSCHSLYVGTHTNKRIAVHAGQENELIANIIRAAGEPQVVEHLLSKC
jgi:hypothetical protein